VPPDSSDIDAGLIAVLQNDATLKTLVPDGVFMDVAPPNMKRFVIVSLVLAEDRATFARREFEDILYLVKAVMVTSANGNIKAAASRIDALLEDQPFAAAGYGWMTSHREERVRYTEVDSVDATIRWLHRGGRYRVQMAVA
jgi:hypothetical protein